MAMSNQYKTILCLFFVVLQYAGRIECGVTPGSVSWVFQGTALQNNSVLTFNKYDTLLLTCRFTQTTISLGYGFYLHKGSVPTSMTGSYDSTTYYISVAVSGAGTLVYSDYDGMQKGFENFNIMQTSFGKFGPKKFLHIGIALLQPSDAGTYHCTVYEYLTATEEPTEPIEDFADINNSGALASTGALTLVVNTKPGQAHSSYTQSSKLLTYSALILGASKLLL